MNDCNRSTIFINNRNIIYDVIYESELSVQDYYSIVANILSDVIDNCSNDTLECDNIQIYSNLKTDVKEVMLEVHNIDKRTLEL